MKFCCFSWRDYFTGDESQVDNVGVFLVLRVMVMVIMSPILIKLWRVMVKTEYSHQIVMFLVEG